MGDEVRPEQRKDLLQMIGPLYRSLRRIEDQCAGTSGLSMWQYAILSLASSEEGLSQAVIAARLDYSKNRIVGDLDALSELGLAHRSAGNDRRSHAIHVTAAGRAVVEELRQQIWQREDELLELMSVERREILRDLLGVAADAARTSPSTAGKSHGIDTPGSDI